MVAAARLEWDKYNLAVMWAEEVVARGVTEKKQEPEEDIGGNV